MRADAQRNYDRLLASARDVVAEHGAGFSLRDVARRAEVGLGTLYRHFPTREALLDALLRDSLDQLTKEAGELARSRFPADALLAWFRDGVAFTQRYRGIVDVMAAAIADPDSALHASCTDVRTAGARLLARAQAAGTARADLNGSELFALMAALGWLGEQEPFARDADHLFDIIMAAILGDRPAQLGSTSMR